MTKTVFIALATVSVFYAQANAADVVRYPERPTAERSHFSSQQARLVSGDDCELLKIDYQSPYPRNTQFVRICTREPLDLRPVSSLPTLSGRS
ncbi:hypothetical protein [Aliirhizobium smilacinae]|uniref:Uncharacterized protein n=1 Tax=Aliirhizobium smilacinae TaxID=1395944 RepID=A0A5C4XPT9_9HYPH|nr:hypothetical protein [Rhizobium smilacinae]TNM65367.1 hypothetical protein FHP24_03580 [Rhizobium smilacinae]